MKKIFYIARNELYTLFYSPIAWILMIIFLILTSGDYIGLVDSYLGMVQRGGPSLRYTQNLTSNLTTNPMFGYFFGVIGNLYIFFPLITMGLISRETSSGTIKLLYSSPVKIGEIVWGKYLAMICFTGSLLILLGFTLIGFSLSISHPDYGQMLASVFGLFMVLCTYAAIGLFISSLTSYQVVAAIITLAVFALLARIGGFWQDIDAIRSITYYLNIGQKSSNFIVGLLNLRDFTYFLLIILSFLSFTIIRIKSATESISRFRKAMRYVAVVAIAFVIGYITNQPQVNVYYDATRNKLHTITPPTQAMLAKLDDGELDITVFVNLLDGAFDRFLPESQNRTFTKLWEQYIRFKPDIHVHYVYYYNNDSSSYYFKQNPGKSLVEIADKEAKTWRLDLHRFLGPDEVNKLVDTKAEEFHSFFVLTYKGKKAVARVFRDIQFWPDENNIAAALNRLIADPPKIAFLSDEIERGPFSERIRDYKSMASRLDSRYALINQGYDFDTVSLRRGSIPQGIAALVIADPRTPIGGESMNKICHYIGAGGNLFVTAEPDRKEVTKPLLDTLGLSLHDGLLIQPNEKYSNDVVFAYLTDTARNLSPQFAQALHNELIYYSDPLFRVAVAGASSLEYQEKNGFRVSPLLVTDTALSWNRLMPISTDSLQLKVASQPGDEHGRFVAAVRLTRTIHGKEQRIIVVSDADYLTDPQFGGNKPTRYNYDFGFWGLSYFSYGQFPANTMRPESLDNSFPIGQGGVTVQKWVFYWIIPALIAAIGSVIIIRRKRK
jgi:ABC-2 type transport system permease protein